MSKPHYFPGIFKMHIMELFEISIFVMNFVFLYGRKSKWLNHIFRWLIVFALFLYGILMLINEADNNVNLQRFYLMLSSPLLFSLIDKLIKHLSIKVQDRDIFLWLRGSTEIDDTKLSGGNHVSGYDRFFSIILLFLVVLLPLLGVIVFKD